MDWGILFIGPGGSGKSAAVAALSDVNVDPAEPMASPDIMLLKKTSIVGLDVGIVKWGPENKIRLYGAPRQDRFEFVWKILLDQSRGVVLLVNHTSQSPLSSLDRYVKKIENILLGRKVPLAIGVTHIVRKDELSLHSY